MAPTTRIATLAVVACLLGALAEERKMGRPVHRCNPEDGMGCPEGQECAAGSHGWAQCVDCSPEQFASDCPFWWDGALIASAEQRCDLKCVGQRGSQCVSVACDEELGLTCARTSESWGQCVDCSAEAFQEDCGHWSEELVVAAEKECSATCHARIRLL